ncbi:hypothetical protein BVX95_00375 [archaeon D22]|nr:hypothetical protein BVX95_00375 [archaeon D22]
MFILGLAVLSITGGSFAANVVPSSIDQPGTQPQEVGNLESPNKCDNCHGGYNTATEPAFNWRGSMMANAGRDPIFWATLAIAEQDFDGAGDLCIRCHSTAGWLAGRSTPTDGSGLAAGDADGVECDFCHKMTDPSNTDPVLKGIMKEPFVANDPLSGEPFYGSGMSSLWAGSEKLGPYSDADARHQFMENDFIRSVDFCGTCHDVSNSAVGNLAHNYGAQSEFLATESVVADGLPDDSPKNYASKASFNNPPYKYGVVERTFSEYKAGLISKTPVGEFVNLPADLKSGALKAIYDAATDYGTKDANYEDGDVRYYSCQTCHMRPIFGQGCNKNPPFRSDLPLHDMTGGNYWMPEAIKYLDGLSKLRLGGGLNDTQMAALDAGILRAKEQLNLAATLVVDYNSSTVKIVNHTGHKLISGYPEGRRMWIKTTWMDDGGKILRVDGDYGEIGVIVNGVNVRSIKNLGDPNTKIYEAHYGIDQQWAAQLVELGYPNNLALSYDRNSGDVKQNLGELALSPAGTEFETFHFVLNNVVHKDNRIPPYGMDYETARKRNALPVPADQYGGGPGKQYDYYDTVALNPPSGATNAVIELLYQPTSWEYIQFLDLANNQPVGSFLENEGKYMLEAWLNTGMAEPYVMASATWGNAQVCDVPIPTLQAATPGSTEVTSNWTTVAAEGYNLFYDQSGKAQLVANVGASTTFTDTGLTNGQEYCYKVTAYAGTCESGFSNIICAIPNQPGQANTEATLSTGRYETSGKGKTQVKTFIETTSFAVGDQVIVRSKVLDETTGLPIPNATVTVDISGPESTTVVTGPSGSDGIAEATWSTQAANRKGNGGTTPGSYVATTTDVSAAGYDWDGIESTIQLTLQ